MRIEHAAAIRKAQATERQRDAMEVRRARAAMFPTQAELRAHARAHDERVMAAQRQRDARRREERAAWLDHELDAGEASEHASSPVKAARGGDDYASELAHFDEKIGNALARARAGAAPEPHPPARKPPPRGANTKGASPRVRAARTRKAAVALRAPSDAFRAEREHDEREDTLLVMKRSARERANRRMRVRALKRSIEGGERPWAVGEMAEPPAEQSPPRVSPARAGDESFVSEQPAQRSGRREVAVSRTARAPRTGGEGRAPPTQQQPTAPTSGSTAGVSRSPASLPSAHDGGARPALAYAPPDAHEVRELQAMYFGAISEKIAQLQSADEDAVVSY